MACCLTLATKVQDVDPQPEPPAKFLEPTEAARLASEVKRRSRPTSERSEPDRDKSQGAKGKKKRKKAAKQRGLPKRKRTRVRTVVATMENSETFGWQVAAEVHRRGLDQANRKACVCDGQAYNWSIYEMHLLPVGFVAILDFVHLMAYLYDAAHAYRGGDAAQGMEDVRAVAPLGMGGEGRHAAVESAPATSELAKQRSAAARKETIQETLTYVTNNRRRMDYAEYRRLGLPISSAPVESTIKQINRRVKGSEKFWLEGGAEAILQLRAAQLSEDDRWNRYWSRPRKHRRAVGSGRLAGRVSVQKRECTLVRGAMSIRARQCWQVYEVGRSHRSVGGPSQTARSST